MNLIKWSKGKCYWFELYQSGDLLYMPEILMYLRVDRSSCLYEDGHLVEFTTEFGATVYDQLYCGIVKTREEAETILNKE